MYTQAQRNAVEAYVPQVAELRPVLEDYKCYVENVRANALRTLAVIEETEADEAEMRVYLKASEDELVWVQRMLAMFS